MSTHDWISVVGIVLSALLALVPWLFMVHAKLAVIASRLDDLGEKVEKMAEAMERLWAQSAEHEARLQTHGVELGHVVQRLCEIES